MRTDDDRLAQLEARVAALEARVPSATGVRDDGAAGTVTGAGVLEYRGEVHLAGQVQWRIRYDVNTVLALPGATIVDVLSAVGHPMRLAVVRRLLTGSATAAELQEQLEVNSSGKLYHHLRALVAAHVVTSEGQIYSIPSNAVVPVLTLMLAAGDVAGQLHRSADDVVGR